MNMCEIQDLLKREARRKEYGWMNHVNMSEMKRGYEWMCVREATGGCEYV